MMLKISSTVFVTDEKKIPECPLLLLLFKKYSTCPELYKEILYKSVS